MVKKANSVEKEPEALRWSWMAENLKPFMTDDRGGSFRKHQLLEQIATSTDQSDYLWYRTRYVVHRSIQQKYCIVLCISQYITSSKFIFHYK